MSYSDIFSRQQFDNAPKNNNHPELKSGSILYLQLDKKKHSKIGSRIPARIIVPVKHVLSSAADSNIITRNNKAFKIITCKLLSLLDSRQTLVNKF